MTPRHLKESSDGASKHLSIEKQTLAERADGLLERLEACQRAAVGALRQTVDRLDDAVPNLVDDPSLRKNVVVAIGDYYEQLASTTTEFIARTVRAAIGTLDERPADSAGKANAGREPEQNLSSRGSAVGVHGVMPASGRTNNNLEGTAEPSTELLR